MRGARKISTMVVVAAGFTLSPAAAQAAPTSGVAIRVRSLIEACRRALADAEIVEGHIHTVYSRSALVYDLLAAIGFLLAQRPRHRSPATTPP
jgi:hypothetical protein